jgi:hypothetical protein
VYSVLVPGILLREIIHIVVVFLNNFVVVVVTVVLNNIFDRIDTKACQTNMVPSLLYHLYQYDSMTLTSPDGT